jgi:uncharacterized protein (TIGR00255 family)
MLKSMTAFAEDHTSEADLTVDIEIRSYNSRHLDIMLRMPPGYASLEERIKSAISGHLERGRIEVRIKVKDVSGDVCVYEADIARAKAYYAAAQALRKDLHLPGDLTLENLLVLPGLMQPIESSPVADVHWPIISQGLDRALETLDKMRRIEGGHIEKDLEQRIAWMETQLDQIEQATDGLIDQYREKLVARMEALTRGVVALDPVRLAQEAALLADRSDISEEIVRARSHVAQFRTIMQGPEPAGRKLNFLLQEFNREFNTMGSKVTQAALAHMIVAVKAEIEKLREQVQNIE